MNEARVTFKDYVEWTIQDLDVLRRSVETPDDELVNLPALSDENKGKDGEVQFLKLDPHSSVEQKRERMREAAFPRLNEIYISNLSRMANADDGMSGIVNSFFQGLDQVFKADTTKPQNETVQDYLGRKILNPIRKLLSNPGLGNEQALARAKYLYSLIERKALEAGD